MARRLLLNLLLVLVVIGLALFIYLDPEQAQNDERRSISSIDPDAVSSIEITRLHGGSLSFKKRDGHWFVVRDADFRADDFQISTLLALARSVTDREYPAMTLDLKQMGLLPPLVNVMFDEVRFDIGSTEPIDKHRYVMHDTTVYLVPDRFQHLLNARYTNFVDRRLLPPDAVVTGLELPGMSLTLDGDNHWQLEPGDPAISADAIRALVSAWENARALYVRVQGGFTGETLRVHLQDRAKPLEFMLHKDYEDVVLAFPERGIQYHLAGDIGHKLLNFTTEPGN